MAQIRASFGTAYKGMTEAGSAKLLMELFGGRMGVDNRTVYSSGGSGINDWDVGQYVPGVGARISRYTKSGADIPEPYLRVIEAHERAHAEGADEAGAMLYEFRADPERALKIWSWRAAFAKAGETSRDADIFRWAENRYRGTELEPVLTAAKKKGQELVDSGAYASYREFESGLNPATVSMN